MRKRLVRCEQPFNAFEFYSDDTIAIKDAELRKSRSWRDLIYDIDPARVDGQEQM